MPPPNVSRACDGMSEARSSGYRFRMNSSDADFAGARDGAALGSSVVAALGRRRGVEAGASGTFVADGTADATATVVSAGAVGDVSVVATLGSDADAVDEEDVVVRGETSATATSTPPIDMAKSIAAHGSHAGKRRSFRGT